MTAVDEKIINDYNQALSSAFIFENDWYSLAYRCSWCYNIIDRQQLALDVCSDLMMLAADKLKSRIADITDKSQMIKFFSKCAKLTALRLTRSQAMFLPTINKGKSRIAGTLEEYVDVADNKTAAETKHSGTLEDVEFIITNKKKKASDVVINKYQLAQHILNNFRENFDFCYTNLAKDLGLSRSTIDSAMQVLRHTVIKIEPAFALIHERHREGVNRNKNKRK